MRCYKTKSFQVWLISSQSAGLIFGRTVAMYKDKLMLFNATIQASFSVVNGDKVSKQKVRRE